MVVVQKNRKQPHVVARRFRLLVDRVPYFARRIGADAGVLGHVDELERLDRLRFPVFRDFEVFLLQIVDGVALPVGHDDVHADEVDVGAEDRGLLIGGRCRCGRRLLRGRRRRGLRVLRLHPERQRGREHGRQHAVGEAKAPLGHDSSNDNIPAPWKKLEVHFR